MSTRIYRQPSQIAIDRAPRLADEPVAHSHMLYDLSRFGTVIVNRELRRGLLARRSGRGHAAPSQIELPRRPRPRPRRRRPVGANLGRQGRDQRSDRSGRDARPGSNRPSGRADQRGHGPGPQGGARQLGSGRGGDGPARLETPARQPAPAPGGRRRRPGLPDPRLRRRACAGIAATLLNCCSLTKTSTAGPAT